MAIKRETAEILMNKGGNLFTASFSVIPDGYAGLVRQGTASQLAVVCNEKSGVGDLWRGAEFMTDPAYKNIKWGFFPLNSNNAALIRRLVGRVSPTSCGVGGLSVSLSDWLSLVSGTVPNLFAHKQVKPVLVDFSPVNSAALNKTFLEVMDTATWSVLSSGYKEGWAANAAGLHTEEEVVKALLYGYSGIGIDCSGKIDRSIEKLTDEEVEKQFGELDRDFKEAIDKSYLDAEFQLGAEKLRFEEKALHRMVLEFGQAIMFLQKMYKDYLDNTPWDLDFEVDLSAVAKVLTPQEHYFLVNELKRAAVKFDTLCVSAAMVKEGWQEEIAVHAAIAKAFDYRLSFADADLYFAEPGETAKIFGNRVHFKLTSLLWLAALQTLAATEPELYRQAAERAGLPAAEEVLLIAGTEVGRNFAQAYGKIAGGEEKKGLADALKTTLEKNREIYEARAAKLVGRFLSAV